MRLCDIGGFLENGKIDIVKFKKFFAKDNTIKFLSYHPLSGKSDTRYLFDITTDELAFKIKGLLFLFFPDYYVKTFFSNIERYRKEDLEEFLFYFLRELIDRDENNSLIKLIDCSVKNEIRNCYNHERDKW